VAGAALAVLVANACPAAAHVRADLLIVSPAEGASVAAPVRIVVAAAEAGGTASANFTLSVDGQPVDRLGAMGSGAAFTSLSLTAGKSLTIPVRGLDDGVHQIKLVYAGDPDNAKPDIVRRFVVSKTGSDSRGRRNGVLLVVVLLLVLSGVVTLRRKRMR
jgi:hypothetical protein